MSRILFRFQLPVVRFPRPKYSLFSPSLLPRRTCNSLPQGRVMTDAELQCVTWNLAAINNNPFEYYLTLDGVDGYSALMLAVQKFIDSPGDLDVEISQVFAQDKFERLKKAMETIGWSGIDKVDEFWSNDLQKRSIVNGFLKDDSIGSKRLISMPDRFTNTINTEDGKVLCRPTVTNNYHENMKDVDSWFDQWLAFMFTTDVSVKNKNKEIESKKVVSLLQGIKRSKYPALTEEEEAISLPLQTVALAIFDAILLHVMNSCAGGLDWHALKMHICDALVVNKQANVIKILAGQPVYFNADIIFLQEVAGAFVDRLRSTRELSDRFVILVPANADYVRDQNSIILVAKSRIAEGAATEIQIQRELVGNVPLVDGDLCAFTVPIRFGAGGQNILLASFHGDTAGLASSPVVAAVRKTAEKHNLPLILGLDANTHAHENSKGATKHVKAFLADLQDGEGRLHHCWESDDTTKWHTTLNARTYLQPQLNKAVRYEDRHTSELTDCNPKDFIIFSRTGFTVARHAVRDNTGKAEFIEGLDLPTLSFPSDHAIVFATLKATAPL